MEARSIRNAVEGGWRLESRLNSTLRCATKSACGDSLTTTLSVNHQLDSEKVPAGGLRGGVPTQWVAPCRRGFNRQPLPHSVHARSRRQAAPQFCRLLLLIACLILALGMAAPARADGTTPDELLNNARF